MTRANANKLLGFHLALLIFFNSLAMPLVYVDYQIRKDYIAKVLCINKDKPVLQCNGKCHLKKQLTKAQKQTTSENEATPQKLGLSFFFVDFVSVNFGSKEFFSKTVFPLFNQDLVISNSFQVFHPPRV